jgi:uncharacterized protein (DUF1778 family)
MEARVSPEERRQIERAASVTGVSASAFMVSAAVERADEVIAEATSTTVPAAYFDELLAALDEPERAQQLSRAAKRARQRRQIHAR